MATPGISAAAQGSVTLSDTWLEKNRADQNAVIDLVELTPPEAFERVVEGRVMSGGRTFGARFDPRAIHVGAGRDNGVSNPALTYATVSGCLLNDNQRYPWQRVLATHIEHPIRYRFIYPYQTTARGVHIDE